MQEIDQEYDRFIEFGGILNRTMRKYLVQYIQNKFDSEVNLIPELNDQYYNYFTSALDKLFLVEGLLDLANSNEKIQQRVILDTLQWLKKTHKKISKKNPFYDELERLESWSVTPLQHFVKRWSALTNFIKVEYGRDLVDHLFFKEQFKKLIDGKDISEISVKDKEQIEVILHDLLAQWDAILHSKILNYQLGKYEEEEEIHLAVLEEKVNEYTRLQEIIEPFSDYLGWDFSRKLWEKTSLDILQKYDELLENESSIRELADLLGKMREAQVEMEEETLDKVIIRQEWVKNPQNKAEIVGAQQSDDIQNMMSSEACYLGFPETETVFFKKYADKQLLTAHYEDKELVQSDYQISENYQSVHQKEKGPFIICVDTSESMYGIPEQIAKVLTLAILKMAMNQDRKAYLINFSVGIKTLDLHDIANSIDDISAFLNMSFYGGTDATLALNEAIRQLGNNDYEDADVLVVSDFIMHKLREDIFQQIAHYQQNKGTQFHCLTLGDYSNEQVLSFFDTNWSYDPKEKGVIRSLTRGLEDISSAR